MSSFGYFSPTIFDLPRNPLTYIILTMKNLIIIIVILSFFSSVNTYAKPSESATKSLQTNELGVRALHAKNFTKAENYFEEALEIDPFNLTAAYNLAVAYLSNKKDSSAKKLLIKYTQKYPQDDGLFAKLGDTYFSLKEPKNAINAYKKSIELNPEQISLYNKLGVAYSLTHDTKNAEKYLSKAYSKAPKDAQIISNLASVQLANSKIKEAIRTSKRSLQIKPLGKTYITLGTAYEMEKDFNKALIAFQRAKDLGIKDKSLTEKIKELKKLG